jgi:hypothetical protein
VIREQQQQQQHNNNNNNKDTNNNNITSSTPSFAIKPAETCYKKSEYTETTLKNASNINHVS